MLYTVRRTKFSIKIKYKNYLINGEWHLFKLAMFAKSIDNDIYYSNKLSRNYFALYGNITFQLKLILVTGQNICLMYVCKKLRTLFLEATDINYCSPVYAVDIDSDII